MRKGSGITSLADLKGKKIAYAPGGDLNKFFLKVLVAGGLKTTDVQQVQLATPLGAAALENGQVDAALVNYYYTPGPLAAGGQVSSRRATTRTSTRPWREQRSLRPKISRTRRSLLR